MYQAISASPTASGTPVLVSGNTNAMVIMGGEALRGFIVDPKRSALLEVYKEAVGD